MFGKKRRYLTVVSTILMLTLMSTMKVPLTAVCTETEGKHFIIGDDGGGRTHLIRCTGAVLGEVAWEYSVFSFIMDTSLCLI